MSIPKNSFDYHIFSQEYNVPRISQLYLDALKFVGQSKK